MTGDFHTQILWLFLVLIAIVLATFYLHRLEHRTKCGNPKLGNTTQQFSSTARPCCTIEFIKWFLFWVILVTYNIGIYVCIYIYKVSYIHSFFVNFNCNVFSALHAKHFWFLLLIAESVSLDTSGKPTVRFFLKITSPSWMILSVSLDELNSIDLINLIYCENSDPVSIFTKKLHRRCLFGFYIRLCFWRLL